MRCGIDTRSVYDQVTGVPKREQRFEEHYAFGILKIAATIKDGCVPMSTQIKMSQSK